MATNSTTCKIDKGVRGLNRETVLRISAEKNEPQWLIDFRCAALEQFESMPMPDWGADLSGLDCHDIHYYVKPLMEQQRSWDDVPDDIRNTFDRLGIPQAEREMLAGVGAQYESEVIYKQLHKEWRDQGVIFTDMHTAVREHEDLVRKYFSTVIPSNDNPFAALNSAVWSGGSFVYVPAGVTIDKPLQAYFRINTDRMGQFERTLIIAEPGSSVHYIEGCSAPVYRSSSLHSAVVEVVALKNSRVRYTTIQNWSSNVYNLVTKRAVAHERATVEWVDGNFGSHTTMKYPCIVLKGEYAQGTVISLAVAGPGQHQDAGAKIIHAAPNTTSTIVSKSISQGGGRSSYRGLVAVTPRAIGAKARVQCDALMMDAESRSDTYPTIIVQAQGADVGHEASVGKVHDTQVGYLMSRGFTADQATGLIVNGFIDCFVKELPMEYAVEINRLIAMTMEDSIG